MPYANPEDKRRRERERYQERKDYYKKKAKRWKANNLKRARYLEQKSRAKARGVPWEITFDEWVNWWGADWEKRGKKELDLCMARYDDEGPYKIGNIYKATNIENKEAPRPFPECPF